MSQYEHDMCGPRTINLNKICVVKYRIIAFQTYSNIHSVGGIFDSLLFNAFLKVFIPDSLSIDENMFTTL